MHPNKTQNSRLFLITYSCMSLTDTQHFRNMKLFFSSPHSNFPCSGWQGWDEMDQGSLDANSEIFHSGYRGRFSKLAFHNPNTPISLWGQHNSKPKQQRKSQPSFNSKPDKLNCMSSNKKLVFFLYFPDSWLPATEWLSHLMTIFMLKQYRYATFLFSMWNIIQCSELHLKHCAIFNLITVQWCSVDCKGDQVYLMAQWGGVRIIIQ